MCGSQLQDLLVDNHGRGLFHQDSSSLQKQLQQPNSLGKQLPQIQQHAPTEQNRLNDNIMFPALKASNNYTTSHLYNYLPTPTIYSQNMVDQVAKQSQEMDQYLISQNKKLRMAWQKQREQQFSSLLKKFELKAQFMLRHKDEQIAQAWRRKTELEVFISKLELENRAWQKLAQEKEAMVMSLNNTLEQMKKNCYASNHTVEDAESCCEVENAEREVGEAEEHGGACGDCQGGNIEQRTRTMLVCNSCNSRRSCIVFLPCRHLCSCNVCEPLFEACPVCRTPKKALVEALIS